MDIGQGDGPTFFGGPSPCLMSMPDVFVPKVKGFATKLKKNPPDFPYLAEV